MKKLLLFLSLTAMSCQNSSQDSLQTVDNTPQQNISEPEEIAKNYYIYAVIVTEEPVFGMNYDGAHCTWEKSVYTSALSEENHNLTEDEKYYVLDTFENSVQVQTLTPIDIEYDRQLKKYGADVDQISLGGAKTKVIYREVFSFESYKEASISQKNVTQQMNEKFNL